MPLPPGVYRADHVGSLLRTSPIKTARSEVAAGKLSRDDLRSVEDAQIQALVPNELAAGLRSITDGEFRGAFFLLGFLERLGGVEVRGHIASSGAISDGWSPPKLAVT